MTEGFSGADVSAVANTAVSLVLHEYLAKYSTPEEGSKTFFGSTCFKAALRRSSQEDKATERNETWRENNVVTVRMMLKYLS